jgi:hypothetical protein
MSGLACVFARPTGVSRAGKVPVSGQDLSRHDKVVKMASKNHDNSASARNPIDFVSAAGLVMEHQI